MLFEQATVLRQSSQLTHMLCFLQTWSVEIKKSKKLNSLYDIKLLLEYLLMSIINIWYMSAVISVRINDGLEMQGIDINRG